MSGRTARLNWWHEYLCTRDHSFDERRAAALLLRVRPGPLEARLCEVEPRETRVLNESVQKRHDLGGEEVDGEVVTVSAEAHDHAAQQRHSSGGVPPASAIAIVFWRVG